MPRDVRSTKGLAWCLLGSWKPGVDTSLQPERQTLHKAQLTNPLPRSLGLTLHNLEAQSPYILGRASERGNSWVDQQQWGSGVQGADSSCSREGNESGRVCARPCTLPPEPGLPLGPPRRLPAFPQHTHTHTDSMHAALSPRLPCRKEGEAVPAPPHTGHESLWS